MELKNLKTFMMVAETGSMTSTAKRLSLTKSAVSRQITALEDELDAELFEQNGNTLSLTDAGAELMKSASSIVKEMKAAKERMASLNGHLCGELRIGVGSFIEPYIRRAALLYMQRYPDVLLHVVFDHATVLNKLLRSEELDLAFTMNEAYHHEGIASKPCIPFHLSCIVPKNHWLANKERVTYDDIMRCRVIMPDVGERAFQTIQRYTPEHDLSKLPVTAIVSNPDAVCRVLKELECITFLPSEYANEELLAKPIATLEKQMMSNAHWLKNVPMKASAKAFLEVIEKVANESREV